MKQKDIILIIVVVFAAAVISFFAGKFLFSGGKAHDQQVEKVEPISTSFERPSEKYFNDKSINPAQPVEVGGDNTNPFGS